MTLETQYISMINIYILFTLPSQIAAIFRLCWYQTLEAETKIEQLEEFTKKVFEAFMANGIFFQNETFRNQF